MTATPTILPLGCFLPARDLWVRLQRNFTRLEEEKYQPAFLFQREKEHDNWPGDTEGRTLLAWILLARATGRAPRHLDEVLSRWPAELNARGYFGRVHADVFSEQQISSHGWVLQALAELERWRPGGVARALALPIIENLFLPTAGGYAAYPKTSHERGAGGSFSGTHAGRVGCWLLSTDIGCFAIGMAGLMDAAEAFGLVDRLAPLIDEMVARFLALDLVLIEAQTHATLSACRGLIRWAALAGRPELIAEAERRYLLYTNFAWTETHANFNWFGRPRWTEPCAVVDSLLVALELWRLTGRSRYLEQAQLVWFNALGHGQRPNGGFGCDNCPGADGETTLFHRVFEAHWCCTMRGAEGLARVAQYQGVVEPDGTLLLPFGLPGDLTLDGDVRLRVESSYPSAAEWTLTNASARARLRARLFVPPWLRDLDHPARDGWISVELAAGESRRIQGLLVEAQRPLLPSTRLRCAASVSSVPKDAFVVTRGPLVLAGKPGDALDAPEAERLEPIRDAFLANNGAAPRRLIFSSDRQSPDVGERKPER